MNITKTKKNLLFERKATFSYVSCVYINSAFSTCEKLGSGLLVILSVSFAYLPHMQSIATLGEIGAIMGVTQKESVNWYPS